MGFSALAEWDNKDKAVVIIIGIFMACFNILSNKSRLRGFGGNLKAV
jgi:hypothetical protein